MSWSVLAVGAMFERFLDSWTLHNLVTISVLSNQMNHDDCEFFLACKGTKMASPRYTNVHVSKLAVVRSGLVLAQIPKEAFSLQLAAIVGFCN